MWRSCCTHVSTGTVSRQVNEYMSENGGIVPTRGVIHDIGRAMTHKGIIIRLYKQGYQTPEIARTLEMGISLVKEYLRHIKEEVN